MKAIAAAFLTFTEQTVSITLRSEIRVRQSESKDGKLDQLGGSVVHQTAAVR